MPRFPVRTTKQTAKRALFGAFTITRFVLQWPAGHRFGPPTTTWKEDPLGLTQWRTLVTHLGDMSTSGTEDFLSLCARPGATIPADDWPRLFKTINNWDAVLDHADRHRITPLVYAQAKSAPPGLAHPNVEDRLERSAMACAARNAVLTGEMLEIQEALEQQGLRAMPFKGPALASLCYPEPSLRPCDDLDFFVHPADAAQAKSILVSMGYVATTDLSPGGELAMRKGGWGSSLTSPRGNHLVELQTMVMPRFFRFRIDPDKAFDAPARIRIGDRDIPTFPVETLLVIVCAHGTWHRWHRLQWVADVAALLGVDGLDPAAVLATADALQAQRMLFAGLHLARRRLQVTVPTPLADAAAADPAAIRLADTAERYIDHGVSTRIIDRDAIGFHLAAREQRWDRLAYLALLLLLPGYTDWTSINLPRALWPLYIPLRLLRLPVRAIRAMCGKQGRSDEKRGRDRLLQR